MPLVIALNPEPIEINPQGIIKVAKTRITLDSVKQPLLAEPPCYPHPRKKYRTAQRQKFNR